MLEISLLGTGGMVPLHNRFLTAMLARRNGSMLLIDCGEGTQVTLKQQGWGFKDLDTICFTHFHADHIAGLPGLLLTIGNSGRTSPITIVGPSGIREVVARLRVIAPELPYELHYIELPWQSETTALKIGEFYLSALPLDHMIPCLGYSLNIPRRGKFDVEKAQKNGIPLALWSPLQKGESRSLDGKEYTPEMVLGPPRKGLKVSYITDTRPTPAIAGFITGSDLFICEGLYGSDEMLEKAKKHMHMIFSEAASLAKAGAVKELWLTHYSQAETCPDQQIQSACRIFENAKAGYDRMTAAFYFEEDAESGKNE